MVRRPELETRKYIRSSFKVITEELSLVAAAGQ
jgi:hypothetical protein